MGFSIGIDIGGTFTDTVVLTEDGEVEVLKSPTTHDDLIGGVLANIELAASNRQSAVSDFLTDVDRILHGTTAATNAYIERRGAKVALLTTRGFEDTLLAQRMMGMTAELSRVEVSDYSLRRPPVPLCDVRHIYGVRERVDYAGRVVCPLQDEDVERAAQSMVQAGIEAVAVCLLWSFVNDTHETRVGEILRRAMPDAYVSLSSEVAPRIGEYERTATTLVNAYLGPPISRYLGSLESRLSDAGNRGGVLLLDSDGGAMAPDEASRSAVRLLLSGPAGGLTACQQLGERLAHRNIITFDMGGTSTDVSLIVDGQHVRRSETVAGGYHLVTPMADIRAIGAGGGSIASVEEGGYLRVGPESAGSEPGPACYGRGGTRPTVTDADLVLGVLGAEARLAGRFSLLPEAARRALQEHVADLLSVDVMAAAASVKEIVDARMADLLRTVTIERGHDPRDFVLYAYGGAGGAHAPAFALDLVPEVVVPSTQSVHSAFGAVASDLAFTLEASHPLRLQADSPDAAIAREVAAVFDRLAAAGDARLARHRVLPEGRRIDRTIAMRFARQTKEIIVDVDALPGHDTVLQAAERFFAEYARRYGEAALPDHRSVELITFSVRATGVLQRPQIAARSRTRGSLDDARRGSRAVFDPGEGDQLSSTVYDGQALSAGHQFEGPAVVEYPGATVAVLRGQTATVDDLQNLVLRRS